MEKFLELVKQMKDKVLEIIFWSLFTVLSLAITFGLFFLYTELLKSGKSSSVIELFKINWLYTLQVFSFVVFGTLITFLLGGVILVNVVDRFNWFKIDKDFLNKYLTYTFLIHLLFALLLVFNSTQFSVLVGVISIIALVWPRLNKS